MKFRIDVNGVTIKLRLPEAADISAREWENLLTVGDTEIRTPSIVIKNTMCGDEGSLEFRIPESSAKIYVPKHFLAQKIRSALFQAMVRGYAIRQSELQRDSVVDKDALDAFNSL